MGSLGKTSEGELTPTDNLYLDRAIPRMNTVYNQVSNVITTSDVSDINVSNVDEVENKALEFLKEATGSNTDPACHAFAGSVVAIFDKLDIPYEVVAGIGKPADIINHVWVEHGGKIYEHFRKGVDTSNVVHKRKIVIRKKL